MTLWDKYIFPAHDQIDNSGPDASVEAAEKALDEIDDDEDDGDNGEGSEGDGQV